jgi:hypothetical protein
MTISTRRLLVCSPFYSIKMQLVTFPLNRNSLATLACMDITDQRP